MWGSKKGEGCGRNGIPWQQPCTRSLAHQSGAISHPYFLFFLPHPSHVCTRIPQRLHSAGFHHPWQIPFSPHTSADDEAAGEGAHHEEGGMCGWVVRARTLNILKSRAVVGNGLNKEATPATGYNKAPQLPRDGWNINLISMYK